MIFIELEKTYDRMSREILWKALERQKGSFHIYSCHKRYVVNLTKQRPLSFDVNKQFSLYIKFLMMFSSVFIIGEVDDKELQRDHI